MTNLPADVLQNYTKSLLEKEETVQNLVEEPLRTRYRMAEGQRDCR